MNMDEYDGWPNRETWAVALHINNDEGWQESVRMALRAEAGWVDEYVDGEPHIGANRAGDIIRESVESLITAAGYRETFGEPIPESLVEVAEDIGSLYRVDWYELGESFLRDLADED